MYSIEFQTASTGNDHFLILPLNHSRGSWSGDNGLGEIGIKARVRNGSNSAEIGRFTDGRSWGNSGHTPLKIAIAVFNES